MTIEYIEIENFLSYYERNKIDFSDGPTIIIGQNNTGKSKLFDAFNWGFYDRAFNTRDETWRNTEEWKEGLINNYSKSLCKAGNSVKTSVIISFFDEQKNKFLLTREYKAKRKSEGWDAPRISSITLNKRDSFNNNSNDYFDNEAEQLIKSVFPKNLSQYFLFQGESISQIMSLNNKSAFTRALRDLSRIEIFEKAKYYAEKVHKELKREYESKEDADKQVQEKKIELSSQLENLKVDLSDEEEQFDNFCRERDTAKEVFDRKNEELKKFEECAKIISEITFLEAEKKNKIESREVLIENQKREIFDSWMYAGTDSILSSFVTIYNQSKVERKFPEPIRQEFIKEMLRKEVCLVCATSAPENSPPHLHIKSLLNDKALDKETEFITQLSFVADNTIEKISNIEKEISNFYRKRDALDSSIQLLQVRIKGKEEELQNVKPADVSEDEIKQRNFSLLQRDRDTAKADLEKFEMRINGSKAKIEYIAKLLAEKQKSYDTLIESSSNYKEKERLKLSEKINDTTMSFYESFLGKLIRDIETEANNYFRKMTERNSAISGNVKVDYDLKEVYAIDETGTRLHNINQANKVSLQISFVAAVLSVSNKFWNTYFPFIADAPISALGGNNKITSIETMTTIFNQSIIILKDDAVTDDNENLKNDLVRNLIRSTGSIKNAYELKMEGFSIEEQRTVIIKIK